MTDGVNNLFDGYLTETKEAETLRKTVRTLRTWRKRIGPAWTSNGKEILYHVEWNKEWLAAGKQEPVRAGKQTRWSRQRTDDHANP